MCMVAISVEVATIGRQVLTAVGFAVQVVTSVDPFGYYAAGVQQGLDDAFKQGGDGAHDSAHDDNSPLAGAAPAAPAGGEGLGSGEPRGAPAQSPEAAPGGAGAPAPSAQGEAAAAGAAPVAEATANGGVHGAGEAVAGGVSRSQEPAGGAAPDAHVERSLAHAAADEVRCMPLLSGLLLKRLE